MINPSLKQMQFTQSNIFAGLAEIFEGTKLLIMALS